jgi:glycosyltransferase involved in cell wall biosynthesis
MPQNQRYILMVVPNLPEQVSGGVARMVGYLRDAWQQMDGVPPMRLLVSRGSGSIWLSPFYLLRTLAIIAVECSRGRVALVHVNVASRGSTLRKLVVVAVASLFGVPLVLHLHGGGYRQFIAALPGFATRLVGWMFRRASRTIVLGEDWRDFVKTALQLTDQDVAVVPNGVPDPKPQGIGQKKDGARLLFMGRLSHEKGADDLLRALSSDELIGVDWSAVIAGDGDLPEVHDYKKNAALAARTEFPGWLSSAQADQAYATSNIFVLPSHLEGLSIALLEAMAHGLAVVVTPVGAHSEVIDDGKNGILVPPGDSVALAAALHRLISDNELRQRLGKAARERFEAEYDISRTAELWRSTYLDVMA